MRFAVLAAVVAGCASGRSAETTDGPSCSDMSGRTCGPMVDAAPKVDAPGNGEFADAAPDAHLHPDAAPDAPVVHDAGMPDACVPTMINLLANPSFDLSPVGSAWQQTPIESAYPPITSDGFAAQSAPYKAWMGGFAGQDEGVSSVTDIVSQDVAIPAGTTQLVLIGKYVVGTNETTTTVPYDTAHVDLVHTNGSPIESVLSLSNLTNTGENWTLFSHPFAANVAGQTVRVRVTSTNDITNVSNFFFDTLELQATYCP